MTFLELVQREHERVTAIHPPLNSLHEGYAVLSEEVDELWDEVRKKEAARDPVAVATECVQIAAVAMRIANELTVQDNGNGHE